VKTASYAPDYGTILSCSQSSEVVFTMSEGYVSCGEIYAKCVTTLAVSLYQRWILHASEHYFP